MKRRLSAGLLVLVAVLLASDGRGAGLPPKPIGALLFSFEDLAVLKIGGKAHRITRTPDVEENGAWSPDGQWVVFDQDPGTDGIDLVKIRSNGRGSRRLTTDGRSSEPAWSPDGQWLAFSRRGAIWIMRSDGSDARPFTGRLACLDGNPDWSPDGKWLAFIRCRRRTELFSSALFIVRVDGAVSRRITEFDHHTSIWDVVWSPDGRKLAYTASSFEERRRGGLRVVNIDGSHDRRIASGAESVAWSPDGRWIAYTAVGGIYAVSLDGRARMKLHSVKRALSPADGLDWKR